MKVLQAAVGILSASLVATSLAFNQFVWNERPAESASKHGNPNSQTLEIPQTSRQNPLFSAFSGDSEPVPVQASAFVGPNYAAYNGGQEFWFTVHVLNPSSKPLEYLDVVAELRLPGRSVDR